MCDDFRKPEDRKKSRRIVRHMLNEELRKVIAQEDHDDLQGD